MRTPSASCPRGVVGPVLLAGLLSLGARPAAAADQPSPAPPYAASIEVSVFDLSVVVRDGKGRPVTGLKPENFRVTSSGVVQEIENFSEVRLETLARPGAKAATPAQPAPGQPAETRPEPPITNRIVVFFDNLHLHPGSRDRAIQHVEDLVRPLLEAGSTEVMVMAFNRDLDVLQRFSSRPGEVVAALERSKRRSGGATEAAITRERLKETLNRDVEKLSTASRLSNTREGAEYQQIAAMVDTYAADEEHELRQSLTALLSVIEQFAGLDGRKAILYVSDTLTLSPGEDAYAFLDQVFPNAGAKMKAIEFDRTRDFQELTARANAHGVTFYVLGAARPMYRGIVSADRAKPWNPMYRGMTLDDFGQTAMKRAADVLANNTGGLALVSPSDLGRALSAIRTDFESYYSLGIRATGPENQLNDLTVDLIGVPGNPEVRVRRGYMMLSEEERTARAVLARLDLPRDDNPLEVVAELGTLGRLQEGEIALSLKLKVPWSRIALQADGDTLRGELVARLAFRDADDKTSPVRTLRQPVELPARFVAAAQKESYTYTLEFSLPPGRWTISVGLTDTLGRTTSYLLLTRALSAAR